MYERIGFKEPPFIEAGAATNVTPYIPQKFLKQLNVTIECALGGQCSPLILGGAAGSGKTTVTKYYFGCGIQEKFGEKIEHSLMVHYTITDTDELRDVTTFYNRLLNQVLDKVKQDSPKAYKNLLRECDFKARAKSKDTREMLDLFKDTNKFLRNYFSPLIYIIDEIDYMVDLINAKDYTFVEHLRHMIDLFSEIRFVVLVLASTKLPASFIRGMLRQALGPMADRISESVELRYSEEDFLNFVKTRLREPIVEEEAGKFVRRSIRLKTRDILEKDYGVYFPFTEESLRYLYKREKGHGVTIERLRKLERKLAKLVNVYCNAEYANTKGMKAGEIFEKKNIEKFLTVEGVDPGEGPVVARALTPKEEEWFVEFFGFRSQNYLKFSHEKCVAGCTLALFKYLEGRLATPGIFPSESNAVRDYIDETKRGLKFFGHSFGLRGAGCYNVGVTVTLLREKEIDTYGWDSLKEIVNKLYSLTPLPQKKICVIFVEDDFEFAEVARKLIEQISGNERDMCIKEEDVENIKVINEKLMIRSANSFRVVFIKHSSLVDVLSILAKTNRSEICSIGDLYFQSVFMALNEWMFPYDFNNYTPSMERIIQIALLAPAVLGEFSLTERTLTRLFLRAKLARDRFDFINALKLNGFARETKTGIFEVSVPPVLAYLFKKHPQFNVTEIQNEFGDVMTKEIAEFLQLFLGFEETGNLLTFEDVDLRDEISSAEDVIRMYKELTQDLGFESHREVIRELEKIDYEKLDQKFGLKIAAGFSLTEHVASRLVEAIQSQVESEIRRIRERKRRSKQQKFEEGPSEDSSTREPPIEIKADPNAFLQFLKKPKTWNQIRRKYTRQELPDEELWTWLRRLHEENKILFRVKKRAP